jgi:energy-coupling factor transport system ATP-binding protein
MNGDGATVVWATPGGEDLRDAKRIVYLDGGEVRFDGPSDGFEAAAREKGFDVLASDVDAPLPTSCPRGADGESVVSMRSLLFAYDDIEVFRDASGEIRAGEAIGIAGRVGSGKSTLLSLIGGVLEPTGGEIHRTFAKPVEKKNGRREQAVFYLFQSPERLFFAETVFEEVAFGLKNLGVPRGDLEGRVKDALSRVALDPGIFLDRLPFSLSLGEMRRLAFAIAYALRPKLLLLDEPTSCLDSAGRKILGELIGALRSEGTTIVAASHDRAVLRQMVDRRLVIDKRRLVDS